MKLVPIRGLIQLLHRFIIPFLLLKGCVSIEKLKNIYSWKALEFAFPNEHARENAIREGRFIPGTPVPIDVDFYHKGFTNNFYIILNRNCFISFTILLNRSFTRFYTPSLI